MTRPLLALAALTLLASQFVLGAQPPAPGAFSKHVLAWADVRNGYQHDSITHALSVIGREHQRGRLRVQATNQFVEVGLPGSDGPNEHGRIGALAQGVRDGDRIFVDVETDEKRSRLCHG